MFTNKRIFIFFATFCFWGIYLFPAAIPTVQNTPKVKEEEKTYQNRDAVIVSAIDKLILVSPDFGNFQKAFTTHQPVQIYDLHLSREEQQFFQDKLSQFIKNEPLTLNFLSELKKEIIYLYKKVHRPVVFIKIPEQEITNKVLIIEVIEGKLEKKQVLGNKYFSTKRIQKNIRLKENEIVRSDILTEDISWLNRNPFRNVDVVFYPAKELYKTNLDVIVQDRWPYRFYLGTENTGYEETGYERLYTGINFGNLWNADNLLSYQFMSSYDFKKFLAHTLHYSCPLPWRNLLVLFGGYSSVDTEQRLPGIKSKGYSLQTSLRYEIPLTPYYRFLHELKLGFDFKRTNNNVSSGGEKIVNSSVNISQFVGEYNLSYTLPHLKIYFCPEIFWSPGKMLPDESTRLYRQLRENAKSSYVYGKCMLQMLGYLPKDFTIEGIIRGQIASRALLTSEQFGLGGFFTVRGYKEREVNVDNAFVVNLEARTPSTSLFQLFCTKKIEKKDSLLGLGFIDFGLGGNNQRKPLPKDVYYLLSVGPGIRYSVENWLDIRFDWGIQLMSVKRENSGHQRIHFNVIFNI